MPAVVSDAHELHRVATATRVSSRARTNPKTAAPRRTSQITETPCVIGILDAIMMKAVVGAAAAAHMLSLMLIMRPFLARAALDRL